MAHSMLFVLPETPSPRGGSALRRVLQGMAGLALLAFAGVASISGSSGCGKFCDGGFVRAVPGNSQGICEGLCEPSLCANPNNVCVDNRCTLLCTSQTDCPAGQDCLPAKTDGDGGAVTTCQPSGRSGIGTACPFGVECTTTMGDTGGQQPSCPDGSNCDYTQCSDQGACKPDPVACSGVSGTCWVGKCSDGKACTVQGCPQSECKPLLCLSQGAGDPTAYCTLQDCHADADCGTGLTCKVVRDPHQICGKAAPPTACGTTKDPCVDPSMNMANGTTYAAGPLCTLRNECRVRGACDPCTSDVDCSRTPGMKCAQVASASVCAFTCDTDGDCVGGFQCTGGACVPRAGACVGNGGFCEPCVHDTDCAAGAYCGAESAGGEHFCFQSGIACTTNADCPKSPSGLHGTCLNESENVQSTDPAYHTCYLPYFSNTDRFSCWAGNTGFACGGGSDCVSKTCVGANAAQGQLGTCK